MATFAVMLSHVAIAGPPVRLWGGFTGQSIGRLDVFIGAFHLSSDRAGGAFVSYNAGGDVYLARHGPTGSVAAGWPAGGVPIDDNPQHGAGSDTPVVDDSSRVLICYYMSLVPTEQASVFALSFEPDGTLSPGWPAAGRPVSPRNSPIDVARAISDGDGGWWIAWGDGRSYDTSGFDLYLQHLTRTGSPAPGWPEYGIAVTKVSGDQGTFLIHDLALDGQGGVLVFWGDGHGPELGVHMQHFLADGGLAPGWPAGGRWIIPDGTTGLSGLTAFVPEAFPGPNRSVLLFTIGLGGEFLDQMYGTYGVDTSGVALPPWSQGPRVIVHAPGLQYDGHMASDGEAGVFATWTDYRDGPNAIYVQHILPTGDPAPGWSVNGVQGIPGGYFPRLVGDGHGGLYVSFNWEASAPPYVRVQHLGADGHPEAGWGTFGVPASEQTPELQDDTQICSDGAGGAIVVWRNYEGGLFAQRFAGDLVTAAELSLVSADATSERVSLEWRASESGVPVATLERRTEGSAWAELAQLVPDGEGRFRYEDGSVAPGERYAYRLRYAERVTSEAWVEVPGLASFALAGARPNPARGSELRVSFALASEAAAELSLYDVSGRRVAARAVSALGAGTHVVRLAERERLKPGLYWLRLTQGAQQATRRVVVAE